MNYPLSRGYAQGVESTKTAFGTEYFHSEIETIISQSTTAIVE